MSVEDVEALKKQLLYINKQTQRIKKKIVWLRVKKMFGLSVEKEANKLLEEQTQIVKMAKELFRRVYGDDALRVFSELMRQKYGDLNGIW